MSVIESLARNFSISAAEAEIFLAAFSRIELSKNDTFLERGKVCNKIGLIEKGLMKCCFNKEGMEIVFEFAFENNFISDYYSYSTEQASEKEITCLEPTTLYVINRQELTNLCNEHSFVESLSRRVNEFLFLKMHDRLKSYLLDSPTTRYLQLIGEKQDLVNRIPQYLAASYLNVKPETISRIRKKISTGAGS
jgi:CRP-like cAMP-binding protein